MARATTKNDLLDTAFKKYTELQVLIQCMTENEKATPFDFSNDEKKKEAHWKRDKNLRDIKIHLYEWHKLILDWVKSNRKGEDKSFLPQPYNWKTYGKMNIKFWEQHQNTSLEKATIMLNESHVAVLELAKMFTNEQLFSKNVYTWVGGSTLGSYFVSATASHYDWAIKKIKTHKKNCKLL